MEFLLYVGMFACLGVMIMIALQDRYIKRVARELRVDATWTPAVSARRSTDEFAGKS